MSRVCWWILTIDADFRECFPVQNTKPSSLTSHTRTILADVSPLQNIVNMWLVRFDPFFLIVSAFEHNYWVNFQFGISLGIYGRKLYNTRSEKHSYLLQPNLSSLLRFFINLLAMFLCGIWFSIHRHFDLVIKYFSLAAIFDFYEFAI